MIKHAFSDRCPVDAETRVRVRVSGALNKFSISMRAGDVAWHRIAEYEIVTPAAPTHEDHDRRKLLITPTILLYSGRQFDFNSPVPLTIEEVAASLSKTCRFTGHCRKFYSVAQHAVLVSMIVPTELAMQGLHHDDVEAVMGDMSGPLKQMMPSYKAMEHRIEPVILGGFGLPSELDPRVKRADLIALATEKRDLMPHDDSWRCLDGLEPINWGSVHPVGPDEAEEMFLLRHRELTGGSS